MWGIPLILKLDSMTNNYKWVLRKKKVKSMGPKYNQKDKSKIIHAFLWTEIAIFSSTTKWEKTEEHLSNDAKFIFLS